MSVDQDLLDATENNRTLVCDEIIRIATDVKGIELSTYVNMRGMQMYMLSAYEKIKEIEGQLYYELKRQEAEEEIPPDLF